MTWNLQRLYASFNDPEYTADINALEAIIAQTKQSIAALAHDETEAESLTLALKNLQTLYTLYTKTDLYAALTLAVDANNEPARAWYEKLLTLGMDISQIFSAFTRFMDGVADIDALCNANPLLKDHEYLLKSAKRDAGHVIDPALEPIVLKMQLTGARSWEQLRDQLDANHLIDFAQDGQPAPLPLSAIRGMAYSADGETRKAAYEAEIAAYPRIEIPMAACLNGIKGEALTMCELRKFPEILDWSLDSARMDRETLTAMLSAIEDSLPSFREFYRLKARMLGYDGGLKFYDLFAPLGKASRQYTLDEARALLEEILGKFSGKMRSFVSTAFDERWIDAYPREGKQGGAFCAGAHPLKISYILSNFDGSLGSVSTLAHELGHAYHNECMKDESILMSDYPMPLAETASIFNETLLVGNLLAQATDEEKITLLDHQITEAGQVIVDILSRFIFEREVVENRKDHALSARELKQIMTDAQRQTYGDGLDEACMHPYMWACKSHYYSAGLHFYNFPYAFGLLFGLGVYAQYLQRGEAFVGEYDKLLRATGRGDVREVARAIGIDVADKAFWKQSLKVVEDQIATLSALFLHQSTAHS